MVGIIAKENEPIERLLRKFKRVSESTGILPEVRKNRSYEKPCDKRRRERNAAIRKQQLLQSPDTCRRKRKRRKVHKQESMPV